MRLFQWQENKQFSWGNKLVSWSRLGWLLKCLKMWVQRTFREQFSKSFNSDRQCRECHPRLRLLQTWGSIYPFTSFITCSSSWIINWFISISTSYLITLILAFPCNIFPAKAPWPSGIRGFQVQVLAGSLGPFCFFIAFQPWSPCLL